MPHDANKFVILNIILQGRTQDFIKGGVTAARLYAGQIRAGGEGACVWPNIRAGRGGGGGGDAFGLFTLRTYLKFLCTPLVEHQQM